MAKRMADSSRYAQTMPIKRDTSRRARVGAALLCASLRPRRALSPRRRATPSAPPPRYDGIAADGARRLLQHRPSRLVPGDTDTERDVYERSYDETLGEYVTREVSIGPAGGNDACRRSTTASPATATRSSSRPESRWSRPTKTAAKTSTCATWQPTRRRSSRRATRSCSHRRLRQRRRRRRASSPVASSPSGDEVFFVSDRKAAPATTTTARLDVYVRDLGGAKRPRSSPQATRPAPGRSCGNGAPAAVFEARLRRRRQAFFTSTEALAGGDDRRTPRHLRARPGRAARRSSSRLRDRARLLPGGPELRPRPSAAPPSDGSHVFFESNEQISAADDDSSQDVYDWSGSGAAAPASRPARAAATGLPTRPSPAASADGGAVFFETSERLDPAADDRFGSRTSTSAPGGVDRRWSRPGPEGGNGPAARALRVGLADGSSAAAIFSTDRSADRADTDTARDVYAALRRRRRRWSRPGPRPAATVPLDASFAGASDDGSHVFFVTARSSGSAKTQTRSADIYLRVGGETTLVSTGPDGRQRRILGSDLATASPSDGSHGLLRHPRSGSPPKTTSDAEDRRLRWTRRRARRRRCSSRCGIDAELALGPPPPVAGRRPIPLARATSTDTVDPRPGRTGAAIKLYATLGLLRRTGRHRAPRQQLAGPGIAGHGGRRLDDDASAPRRNWQGVVSPCSSGVSYTQATPAPPPPPPPGEDGRWTTGGGAGSGAGTGAGAGGRRAATAPTDRLRLRHPADADHLRARLQDAEAQVVFRFTDATGQPGTQLLLQGRPPALEGVRLADDSCEAAEPRPPRLPGQGGQRGRRLGGRAGQAHLQGGASDGGACAGGSRTPARGGLHPGRAARRLGDGRRSWSARSARWCQRGEDPAADQQEGAGHLDRALGAGADDARDPQRRRGRQSDRLLGLLPDLRPPQHLRRQRAAGEHARRRSNARSPTPARRPPARGSRPPRASTRARARTIFSGIDSSQRLQLRRPSADREADLHRQSPCTCPNPSGAGGADRLRRRQPAQRDPRPTDERRGCDEREAGFTIIEVLVAVADPGDRGAGDLRRAQRGDQQHRSGRRRRQVALDLAQQELEALHSLTNEELAVTTTPPHSSDALDPDYRVTAAAPSPLSREPLGAYRKLVVNGGAIEGDRTKSSKAASSARSEPFESGDVSGTIYRYVVWRNDDSLPARPAPASQDYKQIVVAVKLDTPGNQAGERGYVEVQSDFVDPDRQRRKRPGAGRRRQRRHRAAVLPLRHALRGERRQPNAQEITGDHLLHNTLGTCASGLQTGDHAGRAGRAAARRPARPGARRPERSPALYDYSDDTYLEPTPTPTRACRSAATTPAAATTTRPEPTNPESQVHRWVTDPMASDFKMTGKVTLEFYTRTLNDALYTGDALRLPLQTQRSRLAAGSDRHAADRTKRRHRLLDLHAGGKRLLAAKLRGPRCG